MGSCSFEVFRQSRQSFLSSKDKLPYPHLILCYPKEAFLNPNALRVFISTDTSLSTQEILDTYVCRWPVELFFHTSKQKLALDKYQIRTRKGTERYWLIISFVYFICCTCLGKSSSFEEGYACLKAKVREEKITKLYYSIQNGMILEDVLQLVG